MGAGLGIVAVAAAAAVWVRRSLVMVTVNGSSMEPTLLPGDRVLVRRRSLARVRRGDIVVLEPPVPGGLSAGDRAGLDGRRWNIKRAVALPGDPVPPAVADVAGDRLVPPGALVVIGDGAASTDSRQRGFYHATDLLGVVVRRIGHR
jgi:signal peptidase I